MVLSRLPVFVVATAVTLLVPSTAGAQVRPSGVYTLNRAASAVGFTISASMLFKVKRNGIFQDFEGNLSYDPARPTDTAIDLTVYTGSVETHDSENDQLLKSGDFFDVEHFPTMHFVSASTATRPDGTFSVTGEMTIRGVTKRMTIPVRMRHESAIGGLAGTVFESNFQIDRTEFGLIGVPQWKGLKVSIGKMVDIHIAVAPSVNSHTP